MASTVFRNVGSKNRLVDRVVAEIQQQIIDGTLTPGMMLPPERELTEQLGVSRTALREAVRMLVTKGLLETRPGVGTIIKKITSDQITEPLSIIMNQAGGANLDHLDQVRHILEVEIAEVAAREATPEDLERIEALLVSLSKAKDDSVEFNRRDAEFHQALADATHNPLLSVFLNSIRDLTENVRNLLQDYPKLGEKVYPDHLVIFERLQARDADGAREAMLKHLEHARQIQKEYLAGEDKQAA
jgi:GntR family transcriptional repressor for pyruvate dehydrogenase complex